MPTSARKGTDFCKAPAAMTEEEKQAIISKAHSVRSEQEMHDLVNSLAQPAMQ